MSNTISGILNSKKFNLKLNNETLVVGVSTFICMANDFHSGSSWGGNMNKVRSMVERRSNSFIRTENKVKYFIWGSKDIKKDDIIGYPVYKCPEGFDGIHDEYDLDGKYEVIGTILKEENGKSYIETDLEVIEKFRRNKEYQKMENGKLTIYFSDNSADNKNPLKYQEYLEQKDKAANAMICRGHGV